MKFKEFQWDEATKDIHPYWCIYGDYQLLISPNREGPGFVLKVLDGHYTSLLWDISPTLEKAKEAGQKAVMEIITDEYFDL